VVKWLLWTGCRLNEAAGITALLRALGDELADVF
jgi:hypothetical protein